MKAKLGAGLRHLADNVELINDLNVFPVPDGDTGVNMYHTLRRAWQEAAGREDDSVASLARHFAYGALMGARGNSGTILSQLLTGFADGLGQAEVLTAPLFKVACGSAVERAYAALSEPVEGTMLTVARQAWESLPDDGELEASFVSLLGAARASLDNTPELLPLLREAGVVDAGGMGLLCFLQGMARHCSRQPAIDLPVARPAPRASEPGDDYGYDVQFLMLGERLDIAETRAAMEALGWSVIVVGEPGAVKVHVHVDNPALPLEVAHRTGAALTDIVVENMQLQAREFASSKAEPAPNPADETVAVIAVAEGGGMRAVFRELNCSEIIPGGASRNPPTEEFIQAIERQAARHIIVLPNHSDIIGAAEQAVKLQETKQATVLPTTTMLQGIGALVAYGDAVDRGEDFDAIVGGMRQASQRIASIQITRATRSAKLNGLDIRANDFIAIIDGDIRATAGDVEAALQDALCQLPLGESELITLYSGADYKMDDAERLIASLAKTYTEIEFEAAHGGQALYPLLASVE